MQITVNQGQSLYDIALQETGSIEGLFNILKRNNISINTIFFGGEILEVEDEDIVSIDVVNYFKSLNYKVNGEDLVQEGEGDFNNDFNNDFDI